MKKQQLKEMQTKLANVGQKIVNFFGEGVKKIARKTGFEKRKPRLSGEILLKASVWGSLMKKRLSLREIAQNCLELGVKISEQGVDQRINKEAVNFMKEMFKKGIEKLVEQSKLDIEVLRQFKEINITDSSVIALPETMKDEFRGCGGNGPQASVKIQLVLQKKLVFEKSVLNKRKGKLLIDFFSFFSGCVC